MLASVFIGTLPGGPVVVPVVGEQRASPPRRGPARGSSRRVVVVAVVTWVAIVVLAAIFVIAAIGLSISSEQDVAGKCGGGVTDGYRP